LSGEGRLVTTMNEFGSSDLIDHLCHCRLREPYLIGRFGVAKKLFRCRVAADGHDLFFRASGCEECLRVEILGDDRSHASRLVERGP